MPARSRLLALLLGLALVAGACGSALTDEEVLRANGVESSRTTAADDLGDTTDSTLGSLTNDDAGTPGATATTVRGATGPRATTPGAAGTPGETGPIILGSVGNYSGPAGAAQVGLPTAVQVWAASVNAKGGLFGREVKVIVQDDGGDPARYAAAVQDLVENRGVIAFVGQGAVLSMKGGLKYLSDKGIPVIGTDCAAPAWWDPSTNNFPQCAIALGQSATYVSAGVRLTGKTRIGYVFCGESPACTDGAQYYDNPFSARGGGHTVYRAQISIAQVDFTANCQAAQQANVDIMFVLADPGTLARVVRSCDRQGFKPQYAGISISTLPDSVNLPGLSRLALGVPTFPFEGASTPAIDEFRRAMARYSDARPGPAESEGWAAAKLFELAATRAATAAKSLSPKTLIAAMRTVKGETLGGLTVALDFTTTTPRNQLCAFVMQGDGKGAWNAPFGPGVQCVPGVG